MEKQEFIKKLKAELRWQLESKELGKVLREYVEYFDKAAAEGRGAAEVSAELGEPALVATEILSEHTIRTGEIRYRKARKIAAAVLLLLSIVAGHLFSISGWIFIGENGVSFSLLYLILLLPTALALLLSWGRTGRGESLHVGWLFWCNIAAVGCIWAAWYYIFFTPLTAVLLSPPNTEKIHWLFWDVAVDALGSVISIHIRGLILITLLFLFSAAYLVSKGQQIYMALLYLNTTTLFGLFEYRLMLMRLCEHMELLLTVNLIMIWVAGGILFSGAVAIFLLRGRRARP